MGDIFIKHIPTLDLHGYDRESARVAINDFIKDNIHMKNPKVLIIHGKGEGILKKMTIDTLSRSKNVESFQIYMFNTGCTIVNLKFDNK